MQDENKLILVEQVSKRPYLSMVAKHYFGAFINGKFYCYVPQRDILIREDWVPVYRALPYKDFQAAAELGIKPNIPARNKKRTNPKLFQ